MDDLRQQDSDRQTWHHFRRLTKTLSPSESGIEVDSICYSVAGTTSDLLCPIQEVPAAFLWDHLTPDAVAPDEQIWWTSLLLSYGVIADQDALRKRYHDPVDPAQQYFAAGIRYVTFAINPPLYIRYLLYRCEKLGAHRLVADFESPTVARDTLRQYSSAACLLPPMALINCTGLGARAFVDDVAVFPTMGQLVVVRGRADRVVTRARDGWEALVIPRPGAGEGSEGETVPGGCKLAQHWYTPTRDCAGRHSR